MYWKITWEGPCDVPVDDAAPQQRFVLHRHHDAEGPHLDLRLETGDRLHGWRIDAGTPEGVTWATEKGAHPAAWLRHDGDAVREDAGSYAWLYRGPDGGRLALYGRAGGVTARVERAAVLSAKATGAIAELMQRHGLKPDDLAGHIADGVTARHRAVGRLCGLARELDGDGLEVGVLRKALSGLTLEEIHGQLEVYERRFDAKHPPGPVTRPEALEDENGAGRRDKALTIAQDV